MLPTRQDAALSAKAEAPALESTTGRPGLGRHATEAGPRDTDRAEHTPVVLGVSERPRRGAPNRLAATAALLVIVAIATLLWWFIDGERRFTSRLDDLGRSGRERMVEGRDSELVEAPDSDPVEVPDSDPVEVPGSDLVEVPGSDPVEVPGSDPMEAPDPQHGEDSALPPGEAGESGTVDETDIDAVRESPEADAVITGPGGRYRIMVSSHRHEGAALFEAGQLIERGVGAEVVATEVEDRGIWFRVLVTGGYPRLSAAREVLDTIRTLGYEGAWIERAADNE